MLFGLDLARVERLAFGESRQRAIITDSIIDAFLIDPEEAVEADHRASRSHAILLAARHSDIDGGALDLRARGLACQGALPDELVKARRVIFEITGDGFGIFAEIGWPNCLMRLLRVLSLRLVFAWGGGYVTIPVKLHYKAPGRSNRLWHDLHSIGPHIGDETFGLATEVHALIEPLRELH